MLPTLDFPEAAAASFLGKLKASDRKGAIEMFGDNTCKCPPRGGYETYLRYDSHGPNLAFLIGQPFNYATGKVTPIDAKIPYVMPWDKPLTTYVDVDLTFPDKKPYFLPLEMAFGIPMTESQFNDFLSQPGKDAWKGFAQRLRPTIGRGVIPGPTNSEKGVQSKDELENLLSPEMIPFLRPTDAGDVVLDHHSKMSRSEIESKLPRLESATLRLRVVKSGQLKPWMINKFRFEKALVIENTNTTNQKTTTIEFPLNSKYEL